MKQDILGVPFDALTLDEVLVSVDKAIFSRDPLRIGVVNVAKLVQMRRDPVLGADVRSCDLILADGLPVVWAGRLLGRRLPERVAGIDLMLGMLRRGHDNGYRVYCLGATKDVVEAAVGRIGAEYPRVRLVGYRDGYFTPPDEPTIAEGIAHARPDILLVGMSSPRKEHFLARWGDKLGVPVCHGVGGSFDILAGKVRRAPVAWQRLGLEWLYRVKQEPRRLWRRYLVTNSLFCAIVLSEVVRRWVQSTPLVAGQGK
jgi:N-acetylglucosaminyldiphosphoundecaprenol N-acetyl-beta-D-mannosaminyltransferase